MSTFVRSGASGSTVNVKLNVSLPAALVPVTEALYVPSPARVTVGDSSFDALGVAPPPKCQDQLVISPPALVSTGE